MRVVYHPLAGFEIIIPSKFIQDANIKKITNAIPHEDRDLLYDIELEEFWYNKETPKIPNTLWWLELI